MKLFTTFLKIGLFTFGGGYAMIPFIEQSVVDKNHYLSKQEFIEMLAVVQSLPGPISVNSALFIGYKVSGLRGALYSLLGIIIPSFVIILLIALCFVDFSQNPWVISFFKGVRPAVAALIAAPLVRMYKFAGITIKNFWIPIAAILLINFAGLSPVWIIIGVALLSIAINLWAPWSQHNK